ncbi:MAG: hypothetical protein RJA70_4538, partial [Pseudomonadota bacterium]
MTHSTLSFRSWLLAVLFGISSACSDGAEGGSGPSEAALPPGSPAPGAATNTDPANGVGEPGTTSSTSATPLPQKDRPPPVAAATGIPGCEVPQPGASPIRRLTSFEYDNTLRTLVATQRTPGRSFPEEGGSGFDNNADVSVVSRLLSSKYLNAAEDLSAEMTANLDGLLACAPGAEVRACVAVWAAGFGARAFRRPLEPLEVTEMMGLFDKLHPQLPLAEAVRGLIEAFLQSPHFLYRVEHGLPYADLSVLTGYELASRLSYF